MNKQNQNGSALVVIIIILVAAIVAALGFVVWQNFIDKDISSTKNTSNNQKEFVPKNFCKEGEDVSASLGTFCSNDMGIKFKVSDVYKGKIVKAENYEIFEGPLQFDQRKSAGKSDLVYSAKLSNEHESIELTIAKERLRPGLLFGVWYFDSSTMILSNINTPSRIYDSKTDTTITSGKYSIGTPVEAEYVVDGRKVYKYGFGDAGTIMNDYMLVHDKSIIKISQKTSESLGPNVPAPVLGNQVQDLGPSLSAMKLINKDQNN